MVIPSDRSVCSSETPRNAAERRVLRDLSTSPCLQVLALVLCLGLRATPVLAQVSASLSGVVTDQTGATISGATVTVENLDTDATRTTTTDGTGWYHVLELPVGRFELRAEKQGFADETQAGITLVVGQDATVDIAMQLSTVSQRVDVNADAPLVSTTTSDISGLVGEQQVKDLPLNGRSFDLLVVLNPGVVNFTTEKTGGTGISNSTNGNNFAVSGNRPQQNLFLLNGVEYTGAAENNMQPGSTSGELLGVDAVREFNVLRDSYGAEYGKRPGAQVSIVTQSGTNQWHGSAFEFLRNNDLDSRNFFDFNPKDPSLPGGPPLFQRSQFGAAAGGPIQTDKTFFFANYEGLRQNLHQTSETFVPAADARAGTFVSLGSACAAALQVACASEVRQLLNLWPEANGPELTLLGGALSGIAELVSSPFQRIGEDFGTTRVDHFFSQTDSIAAVYTIDDGRDLTATPLDPFSTDVARLREQVLSLEETHIFSAILLNTARFGYSRAAYYFLGEPTPGTSAASVPSFVGDFPAGAVVVGGSTASNPAAQLGLAGSNNGSNLNVFRNLFTYEDQVALTHGKHQFGFGGWLQQFQSNENLALSQFGQASFGSINALLGGVIGTFTYDPAPSQLNWRSLFAAWYAEDTIRYSRNLTVSLGLRGESSTGWNEAHGRAANYFFTNGVVNTNPHVGSAAFNTNNEKFLPEPRIGVAWSPLGTKTVFRTGFGIYNELQDALGYRMDQNAPFDPTIAVNSLPVADLPAPAGYPIPAGFPPAPVAAPKLAPGGVQPNLQAPTLISYSLRVERELSPNTSLTVGYVGSHGYHEIIGIDANEPAPVICPSAPCPAVFPANFGDLTGTPVPAGTYFTPAACASGNLTCNSTLAGTWTWFSRGDSSYNGLQIDVNRRFSHGLSVRGVYTWSKALNNGDSLNGTTANNAPGLVSNPFNLRADIGLATFNATNTAVINAVYELPIGHGQMLAGDASGWQQKLVGGWSVTSLVTLQSGFPFTPQLGYNPSLNGDTKNPVRPFIDPMFSGPVVLGKVDEWFNPQAFVAPPNNSGFYGNLGRDTYIGPGLATWDFSVVKATTIHERMSLQFRAEIFNLLDRANFNTPGLIVDTLTPPPPGSTKVSVLPELNPTAGQITSTSTTARQVQFALKLLW
jgi:Carboxypeptidase regulatory-like domain